MNSLGEAVEILRSAEKRLADRARAALDEHRYADVKELAEISHRVRDLILSLQKPEAEESGLPNESGQRTRPKEGRTPSNRPYPRKRKPYPKFARDGDRLVKIGWSKKDGAEYHHKAPQEVIERMSSKLRSLSGHAFSMEEVLPISNGNGEELPSYQAYLVLAWLRSWECVRKGGRGEYKADPAKLDGEVINQWWNDLEPLVGQG